MSKTQIADLQDRLGHPSSPKDRVKRPIAQAWLLEGWFLRNGDGYEPKAKHLGAGVYELSAKRTT